MTTQNEQLRFFDVIGESVFRTLSTAAPILCKIVRTRVSFLQSRNNWFRVFIADIVSGYQDCFLPVWFKDWTENDFIQNGDMQSGRPVDIAFTVHDFEMILANGYTRDIVAVRVDERWVVARPFLEVSAAATIS